MDTIKKKLLRYLYSLASIFGSPSSPKLSVTQEVKNRAASESATFAMTHMKNALIFHRRELLWDYCLDLYARETAKSEIKIEGSAFLEFGVWTGESINYFAKQLPNELIYGFDSFEGLQEDWIGTYLSAKSFSNQGKIPSVARNVELVKGWVQDTVPKFLDEFVSTKKTIALIHFDMDTYTPTKFVLEQLASFIGKGTIIIFDEFFGYPSWELNEAKAWREFVIDYGIDFDYVGFTDLQVAVIIK